MTQRSRALLYPLQTEALGAGALLFILGGLLYFTGFFSFHLGTIAQVIWLARATVGILLCVNLLFEYGLDIVETSARGKATPPVLRGSINARGITGIFTLGEKRFLKQLLMLVVGAGLGQQLLRWGYETAGWLVWACLLLALPAAMTINAVYNNFLAMLNPFTLLHCARSYGWTYLYTLILLLVAVALAVFSLRGPPAVFLTLFPACIYCFFLFFHVLGNGIYRNRQHFFTTVDFAAERRQLTQTSTELAGFNRLLSQAYEDLRAGRQDSALAAIVRHLDATAWQDFDRVFEYVAAWPFREPALHIARQYLVRTTREKRYMRALALAEWCIGQQADFLLADAATLEQLAGHASTRGQCHALLTLLENLFTVQPELAWQTPLGTLGLDIAGNRLKDEKRHAALLRLLTAAGRAPG